MKKHLLNRCKRCGHAWFPIGFDLSRKCPKCHSVDVDFMGRIYLAMLAFIAVAAGVFWATDRPHKRAHRTAAATTPAFTRPSRLAHATPLPPIAPPTITTPTEGGREALRLYPDLGIANSPLNAEFVTRYRSYQRLQPDFFQDPAWPISLAKESAAAIGDRRQAQ